MDDVYFCQRCLYSSLHPFSITFNEEGVCSGCQVHEEKDCLDWHKRWDLLTEITNNYRSKSGNNYDCILPVSGGQDSYFTVHVVKNLLGLNPLLVSYNKYFNTEIGIQNLANLRIKFNCDIVVQNVNPNSIKKITQATLYDFGSMYWPILAGHSVFPVQTAERFGVPLIVWGAHQGLEQVGMFSHTHEVEMTRRYRKEHDLLGFEADDLINYFNYLTEDDVHQFRYPSDYEINRVGIRGIYLGNYVRWDPVSQHQKMVREFGYRSCKFARSFDTYDYVDCYNYLNIHDWLKILKHGYSKVTDHACREIRHGRLSRQEAILLVRRHELVKPNHLELFCKWLGMDLDGLQFVFDRWRNAQFWTKHGHGDWHFHGLSQRLPEMSASLQRGTTSFMTSNDRLENYPDQYVTIGKGVIG